MTGSAKRWNKKSLEARRESQAAACALVALEDAEGFAKAATRAPWMALAPNASERERSAGVGAREDGWVSVPAVRMLWQASEPCCHAFGRELGDPKWSWERLGPAEAQAERAQVESLLAEAAKMSAEIEGYATSRDALALNVCALARGLEANPRFGEEAAREVEVQFLDKARARWSAFAEGGAAAAQWARAWSSMMEDPHRKMTYFREPLEASFGSQWGALAGALVGWEQAREEAPKPEEIDARARELAGPAASLRAAWEAAKAEGLTRDFAREGEDEPEMWGARAAAKSLKEQIERFGYGWRRGAGMGQASSEALWDALGELCPKEAFEALSLLGMESVADQARLERLVLGQGLGSARKRARPPTL